VDGPSGRADVGDGTRRGRGASGLAAARREASVRQGHDFPALSGARYNRNTLTSTSVMPTRAAPAIRPAQIGSCVSIHRL
jgi:hypothetical protein